MAPVPSSDTAALKPVDRWQHVGVDEPRLRELIDDIRSGAVSPDEAVAHLRRLPFADVGDALVDHHRMLRQGQPEAVYGPGKSPEQCVRIVDELLAHGSGPVLLTRASGDQQKAVLAAHPEGTVTSGVVASTVVSNCKRLSFLVLISPSSTALRALISSIFFPSTSRIIIAMARRIFG